MGGNDHPKVVIAPPLLFLGALIIALGLGMLVRLPTPWPVVLRGTGFLLLVAGFLIAASALSHMTHEGTSADPRREARALVTSGPYRYTRNPIYVGFMLVFLGFTLLAGTLWGAVLAPLLLLAVTRLVVDPEEAYLARRFPEDYADYLGRVRRWF